MPHPNDELIQRFYAAFDRHEGQVMADSYSADATFSDPVFPGLKGEEVGAMWKMLTGRAEDLKVELAEHDADDRTGSAHWIAYYTFSTGRPVVNDIHASFVFRDGLIDEHVDDFDLWRWTRQALGPPGLLLGWTPLIQSKVRKQAREGLDEYLAGEGSAATPPA